jgi:hypothetical protein
MPRFVLELHVSSTSNSSLHIIVIYGNLFRIRPLDGRLSLFLLSFGLLVLKRLCFVFRSVNLDGGQLCFPAVCRQGALR